MRQPRQPTEEPALLFFPFAIQSPFQSSVVPMRYGGGSANGRKCHHHHHHLWVYKSTRVHPPTDGYVKVPECRTSCGAVDRRPRRTLSLGGGLALRCGGWMGQGCFRPGPTDSEAFPVLCSALFCSVSLPNLRDPPLAISNWALLGGQVLL